MIALGNYFTAVNADCVRGDIPVRVGVLATFDGL